MQQLNAWMNGEFVGAWTVDRGAHAFAYHPSWLDSPRRRSLSLAIPISGSLKIKGDVVKNYFDNLLPDNEKIRERLSNRFHAKSKGIFDLLQAIGRDCVGAVQLLPIDATPVGWNRIECEPLSDADIDKLLLAVSADIMTYARDDEQLRISLAGAQEKTALTYHAGQWCRPHGATPTTHILKLPLGLIGGSRRVDATDSVQNEWLCAQIMTALGLPVAPTSISTFGEQTVLVVERFDRDWMDNNTWIARLPQEDFCQALGQPPERKYQRDKGPGMSQCLQLLQGSQYDGDVPIFLLTQLAFWMLAATDGHAKNYSIFLRAGDAYEMTPLYDVLSMWPYLGSGANYDWRKAELAMAVTGKNSHYKLYDIQTRHWHQLAMKNGGLPVWELMLQMIASVEEALASVENVLPPDFPGNTWDAISSGMRKEAKRFIAGLDALGVAAQPA